MSIEHVFVKYGKEEHLRAITEGMLRFAPSIIYKEIEEKSYNKGQGDKYEGMIIAHPETVNFDDNKGQQRTFTNIILNLRFQDVDTMPVFCISCYDKKYIHNDGVDDYLFLTDDILGMVKHDFEDATHALVMPGKSFISSINTIDNHTVKSGFINYFDYSIDDLDMITYIFTGKKASDSAEGGLADGMTFDYDDRYRLLFCKDKAFENQHEYRFVILDEKIENPKFYSYQFNCPYLIIPIEQLEKPVKLACKMEAI